MGMVLVTYCSSLILSATDEAAIHSTWEMMAGFSSGQAVNNLVDQPESTEQQLALAAAFLGKYPQTSQNVDRSEEILLKILETPGRPELRPAVYYLLARIEHLFRENREPQAADYYVQLRAEFPESRLADVAAVKLALLQLDALPADADQAKVHTIVEQLAVPRRATALNDFHQVVASYLLEKQDLEFAFVHLQAARNLGVATGKNRANLQIQVGRVGTLIHEYQIALASFEEFVKDYPSDGRNYMVRQEILKLRNEVQP